MRSNNPVLTRIPTQDLEQMYAVPQRMTIDDVVMRTGILLGIVAITGAIGWTTKAPALILPTLLGGLALGLVASFQRMPHPALVVSYAACQGLLLGTISYFFEQEYSGIVSQAVIGTGACFAGVLVAYRSGALRATPRFRKVMVTAMLGVFMLYMVNIVLYMFADRGLPVINDSTPLGILFSVAVVTLAALSFVLDFDLVEEAIRGGAPDRFAWKAAFGLVAGLIWLYIEMLRLLSKLRD